MNGIILICGDLSARRPGGERTRKPVRLPAERQRLGAFLNFNPVERGFRAIFPDAFFDGRRLAASGNTGRSRKLQVQPPISFLGLGRALQPRKQSRSGLTQTLHLPISFQTASASYEQEIIGAFGNVRKAFGEIRNVEC